MTNNRDDKINNRVKCTLKGKEFYEKIVKPMQILARRNKKMGVAKMGRLRAKIINSWEVAQPRKPKLFI